MVAASSKSSCAGFLATSSARVQQWLANANGATATTSSPTETWSTFSPTRVTVPEHSAPNDTGPSVFGGYVIWTAGRFLNEYFAGAVSPVFTRIHSQMPGAFET